MSKKEVSLKKNVIYNMLFQVINVALPLFTAPYVSRVLSPETIGIYSYTLSIATYFGIAGSLGIAIYGQLKVAQVRDDQKELSKAFCEILFLKTFLLGISIIVYTWTLVLNNAYSQYYAVLLLYLFAQVVDIAWFWQGLEEFKSITIRNTVVKLLSFILVFLCVKEKEDIFVYIFISQGAVILSNGVLWFHVKEYVKRAELKKLRPFRHFRPSLMYFIPTVAGTILVSIDKSMIGWITHSSYINGCYEQAYKIYQIGTNIVGSLSLVVLPRMTYLFNNEKENMQEIKSVYKKTMRLTFFIEVPIALGIFVITEQFIPIFFGPGYDGVIPILKIFCLVIFFNGMANMIGYQGLVARGRQEEYNNILVMVCILNVILNYFLIHSFNGEGAAIATLISNIIMVMGYVYFSRDIGDLRAVIKDSIKYFLAGVVMVLAVGKSGEYLVGITGMILRVLLGGIVYIGVLVLLKDSFVMEYVRKIMLKIKRTPYETGGN